MRECGVTANKQSRELGHECDWGGAFSAALAGVDFFSAMGGL